MDTNINVMIMDDPEDIQNSGPVADFLKQYPEDNALKHCAIATYTENPFSHSGNDIALIVCRMFIENGARAKNGQKYIVGINFYGKGDMVTIDVISLDMGFHKDICFEHLTRSGWPSFSSVTNEKVDKLGETDRSPLLFVGGHLKVLEGNKVNFHGESSDYGSNILYSDGNAIAAYVASVCSVDVGQGDVKKGDEFIKELLEFLLKNKLKPDFYELLVEHTLDKTPQRKSFTSQHIGALMAMKVIDRSREENADPVQIMIEEVCGGGLARHFMLASVVKRLKAPVDDE